MFNHTINYRKSDSNLSDFARAISLPVRVTIIRILLENKGWVSFEAFEAIPLSSQCKCKHLKALIYAGLIVEKTEHHKTYYSLVPENFIEIYDLLENLFQEVICLNFSNNPSDENLEENIFIQNSSISNIRYIHYLMTQKEQVK